MLLKKGAEYSRLFKAEFKKNKNGVEYVIGVSALFEYLQLFLPNAVDVDMHFAYFDNGNYHFSYKYFDTAEKLYVDHKVYHNHIAIYKGAKKGELVLHERRSKIDGNTIDMFMMNHGLPPWTERPLVHHFGSVGMSFSAEGLTKATWETGIKVNPMEDFIVDVDEYPPGRVSLSYSIFDIGNPYQDLPFTARDGEIRVEKRITNGDLAVRMTMSTIPD